MTKLFDEINEKDKEILLKSLNFIGKIEVSYSRPSLDTVIDIASALDITVSELTNFEE